MSQEAKVLTGIGIVSVLLIVGAAFLMGGSSSQTQSQLADPKLLIRDDSNKISTPSAKVTLVEFGDYQCPACGAANPLVKKLLNEEKGKVNFVFRNFSFIGNESTWAGQAAECAGEQGKFWEYHNYLYEHQKGENQGAFSKAKLENFAAAVNLNLEPFKFCLETDKTLSKVLADTADGKTLGINSTPTFFVNGEKLVGISGYSDLKTRIEAKIK